MTDKFLDPMQTDTERIRDLWMRVDQLDTQCRDLSVTVNYHLESLKRAIDMIENDDSTPAVFLLRHVYDSFTDAVNRSLEDHKPF